MVVLNSTKGNNVNYYVAVICPHAGIEVVTDLPENFSMGVSNSWDSAMPYSLAGLLGQLPAGIGGVFNTAVSAAGALAGKAFNPQSQDLSYQVWQGSEPIEIPMELQFDSKSSAKNDVWLPINALMSIAMPKNSTLGPLNILYPPGPILGDKGSLVGQGYGITIKIGRMAQFDQCIITSAESNFSLLLDKEGYPISGQLNITFKTSTVYGNTDLLKAMGISGLS